MRPFLLVVLFALAACATDGRDRHTRGSGVGNIPLDKTEMRNIFPGRPLPFKPSQDDLLEVRLYFEQLPSTNRSERMLATVERCEKKNVTCKVVAAR